MKIDLQLIGFIILVLGLVLVIGTDYSIRQILALGMIVLGSILVVSKRLIPAKRIIMNKIMFAVGLITALVAALMMFCQEQCFLGVDLEFWPAVLGIVGIGLIATSNFLGLKSKKK